MVLPTSVDMFIGGLGYDPTTDDSGYRRHAGWLIEQGRSYVVLDDGTGGPAQLGMPRAVALKADIDILRHSPTSGVTQLTSMRTRLDLHGWRVGVAAPVEVVDVVCRDRVGTDSVVNLYINDYNVLALVFYRSLGLEQVGLFVTVPL